MPPRIVESDDEDEYDPARDLDHTAASGGGISSSRNGRHVVNQQQPVVSGSRSSTRIRLIAPSMAQQQQQQQAQYYGDTVPYTMSISNSRPARQAAIKANETMDVEEAMPSDEDDEDDAADADEVDDDEEDAETEEEEQEDEDAQAYEEDDLEEDVDGENDAEHDTAPAAASGRSIPPTASQASTSQVKIKLNLGPKQNVSAARSPMLVSLKSRGNSSASSSPAAASIASRGTRKDSYPVIAHGKRKRSLEDEEEDEDIIRTLPENDDDEDAEDGFLSENSEARSEVSFSRMTARQKATVLGVGLEGFSELPTAPSRKKHLTEDEAAMRKVETSRRRKYMLNKKLEEEKQETIERLLKKPIGKKSGGGTSRLAAQTKVDRDLIPTDDKGVDADGNPVTSQQIHFPTSYRWISSVKDGTYRSSWSVPIGLQDRFDWQPLKVITEIGSTPIADITYPPPRPPPQMRMLKAGA